MDNQPTNATPERDAAANHNLPATVTPRRGVHFGMPADVYHSGPEYSYSSLKLFAEPGGPAKLRYGKRKETKAMQMGTLKHAAVLEPHTIARDYVVTRLDRSGTSKWKALEDSNPGKEIIKVGEYDEAMRVAEAVHNHPQLKQFFKNPLEIETAYFGVDPETGLTFRCRPDATVRQHGFVFDLKSTEDASFHGFRRKIEDLRYHWQAALYPDVMEWADGWRPDLFAFVAVENDQPHLIGLYDIQQFPTREDKRDYLAIAREEMSVYRRDLLRCVETDTWPGHSTALESLTLSPYYLSKHGINY